MVQLRNVNTNKTIEVTEAEAKKLAGRRWVQDTTPKKATPKKKAEKAAEPAEPPTLYAQDHVAELFTEDE